ncbi:ciliary microtubule inner protein 7 [Sminthopsis crassicaudata]|uniref:ciliary microtubule inner protein 7 n=1 Tax=Sminthopsis crassicaudata TaxID=9301 RepID=UPI003D6936DD
MTLQSALVGSWYNSGFYGHYRGQFKYELAQEYRLAAKPQPPAVFLQRIKEPPNMHSFSKHDNRGIFDPGIGKRKAWEKLKKKCNVLNFSYDDEAERPLVTSYRKHYSLKESGDTEGPIFQPLVHYFQSGSPECMNFNRIPSTTYQHNFGLHPVSQMPDEKFNKEVSETKEKLAISPLCETKEKLGISPCPAPSSLPESLPDLPLTIHRKKTEPFLHLTVSDCLCWLDPLKKVH